ncbi:MAG: hypothetical protein L3V56_05080 [Candidatus Magnetoovum sp. WYHC-5]|nr:hypothetical protein [Candidatus Magnetoovum sp. WYHC-5]
MESLEQIISWVVELNNSNHMGYAFLTVFVMAGIGGLLGVTIELIFKTLGIKSDKIEIKH